MVVGDCEEERSIETLITPHRNYKRKQMEKIRCHLCDLSIENYGPAIAEHYINCSVAYVYTYPSLFSTCVFNFAENKINLSERNKKVDIERIKNQSSDDFDLSQISSLSNSESIDNHENTTKIFGKSKVCVACFYPSLHVCGSKRNITIDKSVKIQLQISDEEIRNIYICSLSHFESIEEQQKLISIINDNFDHNHVFVTLDSICNRSGCNNSVLKEIVVKKPETSTPRVDQDNGIYFCCTKHLLEYLSNCSETKWNNNILVHTTQTSLGSQNSNGKLYKLYSLHSYKSPFYETSSHN